MVRCLTISSGYQTISTAGEVRPQQPTTEGQSARVRTLLTEQGQIHDKQNHNKARQSNLDGLFCAHRKA